MILKGGQKKVLSIATAVTYEERLVTLLEFNRNGEAMQVLNFNRKHYERNLNNAILKDLENNTAKLIAKNKPPMTKATAKRIMQGLKFSEQVFCSKDGDLYRIATIVHRDFDNEVAVNLLSD